LLRAWVLQFQGVECFKEFKQAAASCWWCESTDYVQGLTFSWVSGQVIPIWYIEVWKSLQKDTSSSIIGIKRENEREAGVHGSPVHSSKKACPRQ
jgi:hypothetical protein